MFKSTQSTYPMQSPKVAAMHQFIQCRHIQTFSPVIKKSIQPYGNDLVLRKFSMDSQNKLVLN